MPALSLQLSKEAMDVKTDIPPPTVIQPVVKAEKTVKAKWVAIGAIVTTIVVVGGFVAAFSFMYRTSHAAITTARVNFKDNDGGNVNEKIETYDDDTVRYTMTNERGEQSIVVEDYGRKLEVAKMKVDGQAVCYVTPMNKTRPLSTSGIDTQDEAASTEEYQYEAADEPVTDITFLGTKAREACRGAPVYWVYPKCAEQKDDEADGNDHAVGRQKRAIPAGHSCKRGCCTIVCCCRASGYKYRDSRGNIRCRFICQRSCRDRRIFYSRSTRYC